VNSGPAYSDQKYSSIAAAQRGVRHGGVLKCEFVSGKKSSLGAGNRDGDGEFSPNRDRFQKAFPVVILREEKS
jgi:hypothetical protein